VTAVRPGKALSAGISSYPPAAAARPFEADELAAIEAVLAAP
jgi:hypothetical protein